MGRSSSPARSSAASAIARSWIARPVESKIVISSSLLRPLAVACEDGAEIGDVVAVRALRPSRRGRSRRCGSPAPSRRRRPLPRTISVTAISAFPGPSAPMSDTCWPGRSMPSVITGSCPGVTVTTRSAESASSSEPATPAPSSAAACSARAESTSKMADRAAAGEERSRRRLPFTPAPMTAAVSASGATERLGGEHRRGTRAQRGHRGRVEAGDEPSVLGAREQHEPADGRQPSRRVAAGTTSPT